MFCGECREVAGERVSVVGVLRRGEGLRVRRGHGRARGSDGSKGMCVGGHVVRI